MMIDMAETRDVAMRVFSALRMWRGGKEQRQFCK